MVGKSLKVGSKGTASAKVLRQKPAYSEEARAAGASKGERVGDEGTEGTKGARWCEALWANRASYVVFFYCLLFICSFEYVIYVN